jgi:hypothetical protein
VASTTDSGVTWTADAAPDVATDLTAVSCVTGSATCMAVGGGEALSSEDGGASWSAADVSAIDLTSLDTISCVAPAACDAVGGTMSADEADLVTTTDGGGSWAVGSLPAGLYGPVGPRLVACADPSDCWVAGTDENGSSAVVDATTDGGSTWTGQSIPSGVAALLAMSCPTPSECVAVGQQSQSDGGVVVIATADGSTTWTQSTLPTLPGGAYTLDSVSCPAAAPTDCWAGGATLNGASDPIGAVVLASTDGGATWSAESIPGAVWSIDDVSCPSVDDCWAVGWAGGAKQPDGAVVVTTDGGATWSEQSLPSAVSTLSDVSCGSTSSCVAVGRTHSTKSKGSTPVLVATSNGGVTWAVQKLSSSVVGLKDATCVGSDCWVAGITYVDNASAAAILSGAA